MTENRVLFDYDRAARTSVPEAVFCQSKSREVIYSLMEEFSQADAPAILFTRLSEEVFSSCPAEVSRHYSFDSLARIAFCKKLDQEHQGSVAVVSAGTADGFVTWEAARTLEFMNIPFQVFEDCGVAGLWRLENKIEEITATASLLPWPAWKPHSAAFLRDSPPGPSSASPLLWDTASVTAEKLP